MKLSQKTKTPKAHKAKAHKAKKAPVNKAKRTIATATTMATTTPAMPSLAGKKMKLLKKSFAQELEQNTAAAAAAIPEGVSGQERSNMLAKAQVDYAKAWLTRRGLFFEDMFEDYAHTRLAVYMLPSDVRKDRFRRWLRALDMDLKFQYMPEENRQYDPFVSYGLCDLLDKQAYFSLEPINYV